MGGMPSDVTEALHKIMKVLGVKDISGELLSDSLISEIARDPIYWNDQDLALSLIRKLQ